MKTTSPEHGQNMFCASGFHGNSKDNLWSYCGLVDARISTSEKDLPVHTYIMHIYVSFVLPIVTRCKSCNEISSFYQIQLTNKVYFQH